MKERIATLEREYYNATMIKDWVKAKKLLAEITELENKATFNYYKNLKKFQNEI